MKPFNEEKIFPIIPLQLFEDRNTVTFLLPFSENNEKYVKHFIKKLKDFTNAKWKFNVTWNSRKIYFLFPIKDKVKYYICVIFKGVCSCKQSHVGKIIQNV